MSNTGQKSRVAILPAPGNKCVIEGQTLGQIQVNGETAAVFNDIHLAFLFGQAPRLANALMKYMDAETKKERRAARAQAEPVLTDYQRAVSSFNGAPQQGERLVKLPSELAREMPPNVRPPLIRGL